MTPRIFMRDLRAHRDENVFHAGLTIKLSRAEPARSAAREVNAVSADGRAEGVHRRLERRVRAAVVHELKSPRPRAVLF